MLEELEVLRIVSERLERAQLPFMLTGCLVAALSPDFHIDADSVRSAVASQRLFNLMHLATSIKVDLIVRKSSQYRQVEFARRRPVELSGVKTWIVSREDLILSKLVWAKDSGKAGPPDWVLPTRLRRSPNERHVAGIRSDGQRALPAHDGGRTGADCGVHVRHGPRHRSLVFAAGTQPTREAIGVCQTILRRRAAGGRSDRIRRMGGNPPHRDG